MNTGDEKTVFKMTQLHTQSAVMNNLFFSGKKCLLCIMLSAIDDNCYYIEMKKSLVLRTQTKEKKTMILV